jgi:hypothetical protein
LLLGSRRLLLPILILASEPAEESTCRGANSGPFAGITSDCTSDSTERRTPRSTPDHPKGCQHRPMI